MTECTPGEEFNASMCNQKLIGAQYFNAAWGGNAGINAQRPWEFNSPRDSNDELAFAGRASWSWTHDPFRIVIERSGRAGMAIGSISTPLWTAGGPGGRFH